MKIFFSKKFSPHNINKYMFIRKKIANSSFIFFFLTLNITISCAQNISGVINIYTAVNSAVGSTITAASSVGFNINDHVLLIQMQGADIDQSNTASFGDITAYNDAGNFEYAVITNIVANTITLTNPITKTYNAAGKVQLITVPIFCDATIIDTLTCKKWDGITGGVLAFFSNGTVTMNADINVSGKGFRAGTTCVGPFSCGLTNYYLNNATCSGGKKGEGISIPTSNTYTGGRGKIANGGGGGNPGNCGGGGGANFGAGGIGGKEYSGCFNSIQGIGGASLDYSSGRIYMGGSGGTGFNDNSQTIFAGAAGGGIVMVSINTLITNNYNINANGIDILGTTSDESAGGGGAGGAVCLDAQTITGTLTVNANGGIGGSTFNFIFASDCHGPGGGGGGGVLWYAGATLPGNVTFNANAGAAGLVLNPSSSCYNTTFGAAPGFPGGILFNLPSQNLVAPNPVALGNDTIICPNQILILNAGDHYFSYLWQDGSIDSLFAVTDSGTYNIVATDSAGCKSYDTVNVALYPPLNLSLLNDITVCPGTTEILNAFTGDASDVYLWQDGATSSSYTVTEVGLYWVKVTDTLGCSGSDSMFFGNYSLPPFDLGNDTSLCPNTSITFGVGDDFDIHLWQNNSNAATYTATMPGEYSVTVVDSNGCVQRDTVNIISFYPEPPNTLLNDTVVCPDVAELLQAPLGYISYEWNDASTNSFLEISQPGIYWVTVTNQFTCFNSDTIVAIEQCPTDIFIPDAFTPNGDGINDYFNAIGYNITTFSMQIFNRWGQLIFQTQNFDEGWNGKYDGKNAEVGTYVYRISYTGELNGVVSSGSFKGDVTLIR